MISLTKETWINKKGEALKGKDLTESFNSGEARLRLKPLRLGASLREFAIYYYENTKQPLTIDSLMLLKCVYDTKQIDDWGFQPRSMDEVSKQLLHLLNSKVIKETKKGVKIRSKYKSKFSAILGSTNPKKWVNPFDYIDWGKIIDDYESINQKQADKGRNVVIIRGKQGSGKTTYAKKLVSSIDNAKYLDIDMFFVDPTGEYRSRKTSPISVYLRHISGRDSYRGYLTYYILMGYNVVTSNIYIKKSSLKGMKQLCYATARSLSLINASNPHSNTNNVLEMLNKHNVTSRTYNKHDKSWETVENFNIYYKR